MFNLIYFNFIVVVSTEQRDVPDHNDDQEYEEIRGSRDVVLYSQLNQPRNDVVNVVNSNVQHPSTDQHYEELQSQDAVDDGPIHSKLETPEHDVVQQESAAVRDYETLS